MRIIEWCLHVGYKTKYKGEFEVPDEATNEEIEKRLNKKSSIHVTRSWKEKAKEVEPKCLTARIAERK